MLVFVMIWQPWMTKRRGLLVTSGFSGAATLTLSAELAALGSDNIEVTSTPLQANRLAPRMP